MPVRAAGNGAATPPRNVLLITVDDLRPALGCYGDPVARTPALDKLASQGALFRRAFVSQSWCSPSRTTVLTGLRPGNTRVYDLETHFRAALPEAFTLPQYFKQHGYHTAALGKVFHGTNDDRPSWSVDTWTPKSGVYVLPDNLRKASQRRGYGDPTEAADVADEAYEDGQIATEAMNRLRELQVNAEPFFLCVGFNRPHMPFTAPKRYWDLYPEGQHVAEGRETPPVGAHNSAFLLWAEHHNYFGVPRIPSSVPVPDPIRLEMIRGYLASTSYVDALVGKLLAELERLGLAENTLVIVWGDHGWKLGDFGQWSKNSNFDVDTRVPLIVRGPGVQQRDFDTFVEMVDLFPTLLDYAGLPPLEGLDGISFAPLLRGERSVHKDAAFSEVIRNDDLSYTTLDRATHAGQSVRTKDFRLVRWTWRDGRPEQFELYPATELNDESRNVAHDESFREELAALTSRLDAVLTRPFGAPEGTAPRHAPDAPR